MAQHQQFGVLGGRASCQQRQPPQHLAEQQIKQSEVIRRSSWPDGLSDEPAAQHPRCTFWHPHEAEAEQQAAMAREAVLTERFEQRALVVRTRERYAAVQALRAQGKGIKPIMRELGLAKQTVRRFSRAQSVKELLAKARDSRGQMPEAFKPYLHQRLSDATTNASQLFREIRQQGYRGSNATVIAYLRPCRTNSRRRTTGPATRTRRLAPPRPPKVRQVTGWILTRPDRLSTDAQLRLKQVLADCPHLDATARHVAAFAELLTGLEVDRLDDWVAAVEADDLPALHSFTAGLKRDDDAVRNGLRLPHSSGAVEGTVNRIKMLKRQMYGRANRDLLRKRVLLRS
jgi:transposase